MICENGHLNQADGCCCPTHGNTCGYHPEYSQGDSPEGFDTLAEYLMSLPKKEGKMIDKQKVEEIKEEIHRLETKLKAIDRIESDSLISYKDILVDQDEYWVAYVALDKVLDWCRMAKGEKNDLS